MTQCSAEHDEYIVTLPSGRTGELSREVNFFRLITPKGCLQSAKCNFEAPQSINLDRLTLIKSAFELADDKYSAGSGISVVESLYYSLKGFLTFCDEVLKQDVHQSTFKDSLDQYNLYWKHIINTEQCATSTASRHVVTVARIIANVLDIDYLVLREQLGLVSQTPYTPSPPNEHNQLIGFLADLSSVIEQIDYHISNKSLETLTIRFPQRDEHPATDYPLSRHGIPPSWDKPFIWLREIKFRISCEQRRFILLTGMNPSTTLKLCFDDFEYLSTRKGYRAVAFKTRAGHIVDATLPSEYLPYFKKYIEFLRALPDNPNRLVFPPICVSIEEKGQDQIDHFVIRKELSLRPLRLMFSRIERPFFDGRSLRRNLGVFVSRRNNGDPLRTAKALCNSPQVAGKHYGGQGTREENEIEMTAYLSWEAEKSKLRRSTDLGRCAAPHQPQPIRIEESSYEISPKCGAENNCFFCKQYRPIDTKEYIFSLLSKRARLQARTMGIHDPQIVKTITRINVILDGYRTLREKNPDVIAELEGALNRGHLHPFFEYEASLDEALKP